MTAPAPQARKVLVMELAGLGDNVHLLPALWLVRQAWPQAELHVMASGHGAELFKLTPWVDRIWSYPRLPRPPGLRANLDWGRRLRRERFDVVINTTGSDRSSMLTWLTRAPVRIGRKPADGGPPGWRHLFTQVVEQPYYRAPMYVQKWNCLRDAGLPAGPEPEFHFTIDPAWRRAAGITEADDGRYLHVSPFTSADRKELPLEQTAEVVTALQAAFPGLKLVISTAPNARERGKLERLLALLPTRPWLVEPGNTGIPGAAAMIAGAALHAGGDSAGLHLAMLADVPSVIWYREHGGRLEWTPPGDRHRLLVSDQGDDRGLEGVTTAQIVEAARELLQPSRT